MQSNNINFEISNNTLVRYIGKERKVIVPDGVQVIGDSAFEECHFIESVRLPSSVTHIGVESFANCTSMNEINLPYGVMTINEYAFYGCCSLSSIVLPDTVYSVGLHTFSECTGLKYIKFSDRLTEFNGSVACSTIEEICLPDSLKKLGITVFRGWRSLIACNIPTNVNEIGMGAFMECYNLAKLTVSPHNPTFHSKNNCIIHTRKKALIAACHTSIIPSDGTVEIIAPLSFSACLSLEHLDIPNGIQIIERHAFLQCDNMSHITIPDSVSRIDSNAFWGCSSLKYISAPSGLKNMMVQCEIPNGCTVEYR